MPGVLRRLIVRTVLLVGGTAAAWLLAGMLRNVSASAATVPIGPIPAPDVIAALTSVQPAATGATVLPDLSDPLAPLTPVLGSIAGSLPLLPSPAQLPTLPGLPGLPALPPPVVGGGIPLPIALPVGSVPANAPIRAALNLAPPIGSGDRLPIRPAGDAGAGLPALVLARSVPGATSAPLAPIVPPASPSPVPTPASSGAGASGGPLRDSDLNRDAYSGSLVAIRAPPRDVRIPATGIADDPTFAPD